MISGHLAFFGHSIYMLLLLAFIILVVEQAGEHSGVHFPRKIVLRTAITGAVLALAANSILFFDSGAALWVLRFDLIFFLLVPPFCFGLWEKSAR